VKVLVDTSVWVAHFRQRNDRLVELLEAGLVVGHPAVRIDVACGTPPGRRNVLALLAQLEEAPVATHGELLALIERRALQGRGCGFVDVSLLASALIAGDMLLWTLDKRLDAVAVDLGRAFHPLPST